MLKINEKFLKIHIASLHIAKQHILKIYLLAEVIQLIKVNYKYIA